MVFLVTEMSRRRRRDQQGSSAGKAPPRCRTFPIQPLVSRSDRLDRAPLLLPDSANGMKEMTVHVNNTFPPS